MGKNDGRFKKGEHRSSATEFKPGQHWRERKPFWDKDWLYKEYVTKGRSCLEIANQFGVTENAINFWINKHGIQSRTMSEIRKSKKWGVSGSKNPMYGKRGAQSPSWKGGCTPERQSFYSSKEWAIVSRKVWRRDKGICQKCGLRKDETNSIHIHHIVSFRVVELRAELSNLVLLCAKCHRFVHSNKNAQKEFIKEVQ